MGIIPGALWRGLIMGLVETFSKLYISSSYSDTIAFSILIIILIVKPSGLLGRKTRAYKLGCRLWQSNCPGNT